MENKSSISLGVTIILLALFAQNYFWAKKYKDFILEQEECVPKVLLSVVSRYGAAWSGIILGFA